MRSARAASWRCWAMESAIRFKAEVWVLGEVVGWVDRVGRFGGDVGEVGDVGDVEDWGD